MFDLSLPSEQDLEPPHVCLHTCAYPFLLGQNPDWNQTLCQKQSCFLHEDSQKGKRKKSQQWDTRVGAAQLFHLAINLAIFYKGLVTSGGFPENTVLCYLSMDPCPAH